MTDPDNLTPQPLSDEWLVETLVKFLLLVALHEERDPVRVLDWYSVSVSRTEGSATLTVLGDFDLPSTVFGAEVDDDLSAKIEIGGDYATLTILISPVGRVQAPLPFTDLNVDVLPDTEKALAFLAAAVEEFRPGLTLIHSWAVGDDDWESLSSAGSNLTELFNALPEGFVVGIAPVTDEDCEEFIDVVANFEWNGLVTAHISNPARVREENGNLFLLAVG